MTNALMTGLLCQCGHDYACHLPAPHTGCGECNCTLSRADIAESRGRLITMLLLACKHAAKSEHHLACKTRKDRIDIGYNCTCHVEKCRAALAAAEEAKA